MRRMVNVGGALLIAFFSQWTAAQPYPSKPVRIIVNYTPGGTTDLVARAMAEKLSASLGQPFQVENKPSANGALGSQELARSVPDGHTLLFSTSGHTSVSMALRGGKLPFDPFKDFAPVTLLVLITQGIVVHPALGVKTIPELVKVVKANPGKYSYGSAGPGSPNHLGVELLKYMAGIDMVHVPYKGGSQAVVDLVAGRIAVMLNSTSTLMPFIQSGKIIAIAVGTSKRLPALPHVPTVAEQGYPGYDVSTWYGMFAPAATPRPIIAKLNGGLNDALRQPDVVKRFTSRGVEPAGGPPEELGKKMRDEYERWKKVVVFAKIRSD